MAKKDKETEVSEKAEVRGIWGKPDWKRGKVIFKYPDGETRLVKLRNLPPHAQVFVPFEAQS